MFKCQLSNVNKVKLLSERTSGVPLVIFTKVIKKVIKFLFSMQLNAIQCNYRLRKVHLNVTDLEIPVYTNIDDN